MSLLTLISSCQVIARGRERSDYDTRDILMYGLEKGLTDLDVGLRHDVYELVHGGHGPTSK